MTLHHLSYAECTHRNAKRRGNAQIEDTILARGQLTCGNLNQVRLLAILSSDKVDIAPVSHFL